MFSIDARLKNLERVKKGYPPLWIAIPLDNNMFSVTDDKEQKTIVLSSNELEQLKGIVYIEDLQE